MQTPARSTGGVWTLAVSLILLAPLLSVVAGIQDPADPSGGPPGPAANPPYVPSTDPADGSVGVPLWAWITITFSRPMIASNTVFPIDPLSSLAPSWYNSNTTVILRHSADFIPCTTYRIFADGSDLEGQGVLLTPRTPGPPNPWTFTTACGVFVITRTLPADNQRGVVVSGAYQDLTVWFSRPADPASFQVTLTPAVPLTPAWSNGNTKVTLGHAEWLYDCTWNSVTVSARDASGNPLTNLSGSAPNPWRFETVCISPIVVRTEPANGTREVPLDARIIVTFNKPMDSGSASWSVLPSGLLFSPSWSSDYRVLTLDHPSPFPLRTTFTASVGGRDQKGVDLVPGPVPNPWVFDTSGRVSPPPGLHVARASPDIVLTWRDVPGATLYSVYSSTDRLAPWPWPKLAEVASTTYVHARADSDARSHFYLVRAMDPLGGESTNSTMGVKSTLALGFSPFRSNVYWMSLPYRAGYRSAKEISDELTEANIDLVAKWNPVTQSPVLWYFLRGAWRGTDFPIGPGDGFYIGVLSSFSWVITGTDGFVPRSFTAPRSPDPSTDWVALPYTAPYARASDVVLGIEGDVGPDGNSRIIEIGLWDTVAERLLTFAWTPTGWAGEDFRVEPGSALCLRIVSGFTWIPGLISPEEP
jgi:hypothetical protein